MMKLVLESLEVSGVLLCRDLVVTPSSTENHKVFSGELKSTKRQERTNYNSSKRVASSRTEVQKPTVVITFRSTRDRKTLLPRCFQTLGKGKLFFVEKI